ncbi:MAG: hypothetical protein PHR26_02375, partial [Candidatus ainarchaeum sp.]|nr:hypothetical protein [Candidatus ainarchaeum sp.]
YLRNVNNESDLFKKTLKFTEDIVLNYIKSRNLLEEDLFIIYIDDQINLLYYLNNKNNYLVLDEITSFSCNVLSELVKKRLYSTSQSKLENKFLYTLNIYFYDLFNKFDRIKTPSLILNFLLKTKYHFILKNKTWDIYTTYINDIIKFCLNQNDSYSSFLLKKIVSTYREYLIIELKLNIDDKKTDLFLFEKLYEILSLRRFNNVNLFDHNDVYRPLFFYNNINFEIFNLIRDEDHINDNVVSFLNKYVSLTNDLLKDNFGDSVFLDAYIELVYVIFNIKLNINLKRNFIRVMYSKFIDYSLSLFKSKNYDLEKHLLYLLSILFYKFRKNNNSLILEIVNKLILFYEKDSENSKMFLPLLKTIGSWVNSYDDLKNISIIVSNCIKKDVVEDNYNSSSKVILSILNKYNYSTKCSYSYELWVLPPSKLWNIGRFYNNINKYYNRKEIYENYHKLLMTK